MTCQNLGVLCLHWSIVVVVMATVVIGTLTAEADTKPRLIPPEIINGPDFHVIFRRDNHDSKELPCYATGTPPIVYKWLFNGKEVHSGTRRQISNGSLHLGNMASDMVGYYQCIATNEAGVAISNITFLQAAVFDELPPRVRNTIRRLSIKELNHVVLPCNHIIRSVPSAQITWWMSTDDGQHFRPVKVGGHVTQAQDGSLVFSIVRQNNSAIYKCDAKNVDFRLTYGGSKVNLTIETEDASEADRILKEPPVLLYNSPDVTVLEGNELRLECLYGAWPGHHVEWTAPSGVTNVSHAWIIGSVTAADAGLYSCRAFKSFLGRQLFSQRVNITVQVDAIPSFATPLSNQEVPESGRDVTFTCQGRGRPSPTVTWYKNGVSVETLEDVLNDDHSISGDGPTSVLVLRSIRTSATVTCNVSNTHGSRLQSAIVTIGDAEVISSTSSQHVIITSPMTSANKHHSTRHHERTTKPLQPYQPSTTSYHSSTTVNKDDEQNKDNTNGPAAPHVKPESLSSSTTTTIIIAAAVSAVAVLVVIIVVVVIIVCRRRRRGGFSLPEQGMPLRAEVRIANLQTYDSDDSGFDDVKAESERRALQGHQPPS